MKPWCDVPKQVDLLLLPNIDVESIPRVQGTMIRWPNRCRA